MKVTNLETSKKLKELGFEAETVFYWNQAHENCDDTYYLAYDEEDNPHSFELTNEIKAYDLETILEALPDEIILSKEDKEIEFCNNQGNGLIWSLEEGESWANLAGRILIKLLESKMTLEERLAEFNNIPTSSRNYYQADIFMLADSIIKELQNKNKELEAELKREKKDA